MRTTPECGADELLRCRNNGEEIRGLERRHEGVSQRRVVGDLQAAPAGSAVQRGLLQPAVLRQALSVENLVGIAESEASCEVFGLLKRPDEKWVTERAYDNPKFVEDLVRDIALRLAREPRIARWTVASENFESIHNHSAYAELWGSNPAEVGQ